tara:strand:- start:159 stop:1241 length:1083 start_codon:yes stop_codon:yes gene_type:complete
MDHKAALLALVLVSGSLAGCTGGDPDAGGNDEIDAETLQNLQDFINSTVNSTVEPEWNNDRGDSGHQWTISLSDDQWLEIGSVYVLLVHHHDDDGGWDHYSTQSAVLVTDEGYMLTNGMSPMFGGNYTLCVEYSNGVCYNINRDAEAVMLEWTITYRIHETSEVGYYYTDATPTTPVLDNQIVTLEVSYVPWNSTERIYDIIVLELYTNEAPLHVDSFVSHIENGAYNNTLFHRVIDEFVIQGGNINGAGGYAGDWYGYCNSEPATSCDTADMTIPSESDNGLTHGPGTLAMARSSDPDSGGSQFYIVPSDSTPSHLDGEYTVFGQVISGQDHVDAISDVDTGSNDVPIHDVILESAWVN